jgi:transposase
MLTSRGSSSGSKSEIVVHSDLDLLVRPQIPFGGLDRGVAEQELDLLQIAAAFAAELMGWSAASTPLHLGYKRCTEEVPMQIHTIGVDLGKTVFHLVGLNLRGEVVVRKKCSRSQLLQFTANVQVDLIGMEACAGAHFLGRALREQGHEVRIIPAQYVKPYVKTNKSDFIDAEAIAEAVGRPTMRFVPVKTDDQLDMQSLHRVRERWVIRRTAVINQIRGLLLERGITLRQGRRHLEAALPGILEDATARLSGALRMLISQLKHELEELANFIGEADGTMERTSRENESCRRLLAVPGIGPVTATALIAAIGNGAAFRKGREFSAWVGMVPRESSTGGKQKLLGISKRGNPYLRKLFIQGARAVMLRGTKQSVGLRTWIENIALRKHHNVAAVALANKMARIAWVVLARGEAYRPSLLIDSECNLNGLRMTPA